MSQKLNARQDGMASSLCQRSSRLQLRRTKGPSLLPKCNGVSDADAQTKGANAHEGDIGGHTRQRRHDRLLFTVVVWTHVAVKCKEGGRRDGYIVWSCSRSSFVMWTRFARGGDGARQRSPAHDRSVAIDTATAPGTSAYRICRAGEQNAP